MTDLPHTERFTKPNPVEPDFDHMDWADCAGCGQTYVRSERYPAKCCECAPAVEPEPIHLTGDAADRMTEPEREAVREKIRRGRAVEPEQPTPPSAEVFRQSVGDALDAADRGNVLPAADVLAELDAMIEPEPPTCLACGIEAQPLNHVCGKTTNLPTGAKVACLDPGVVVIPKPGFAQRKQSLQAHALRAAFVWREQQDEATADELVRALDRLEDHCVGPA